MIQKSDYQILIPAGGLGTRLRAVVPNSPKPMALIAEKPFLEWLIQYLKIQGYTKIAILTGYKAEVISDYFKDGSDFGVEIRYSHEESPLGTGGAISQAMKMLNAEHYLVLNGDTLFCIDMDKFVAQVRAPISLALKHVPNISRYGSVQLSQDGLIQKFIEKKPSQDAGLINAGICYLNRKVADHFVKEKFSLEEEIYQPLAAQGLVSGVPCEGEFVDIGIPESYEFGQKNIPTWMSEFKRKYNS